MVIAHTRHPISQPFAGGLESLTWHLVDGLADRGHRVSVFAARGTLPIPGVEHLWPEDLELSVAAREDVSMPTVLTLHTPPTPWLESVLTVARAASGRPVRTSAVSRHTAAAWAHLTRAHVVPNGVDTRTWRPGRGGDRLVWSGRIVPEKAPHHAVQIARAVGMPLVLAGPIADESYAREQVLPWCGAGVEYAGHLSGPELAELVGSSAAALVRLAWDEPYGLVTAEAAALLPEVLSLPREACRTYAVQHHSLDRMVDDYVALYEQVASARPEGPGRPPAGRVLRGVPGPVQGAA